MSYNVQNNSKKILVIQIGLPFYLPYVLGY